MDKIIKELIYYGKIAGMAGLTPGISGNISARVSEKEILITSSGSANGFLSEEDFSVVDFDGNFISGNPKPSSERMLHINYYKKRPDINAVFHCHSPYLTAFASSNRELNVNASPEMIYCFESIPKAKYYIPGSVELSNETSKYFDNFDVVLMENHGVVVAGKNVKNVYLNLELCESYAKMLICSETFGGANILPPQEVAKIKELRDN